MPLPEGFNRAGTGQGNYENGCLDILEVKLAPNGQIVIGIMEWFGKMCEDGNEKALTMLSSIPALVKDAIAQHLKEQ
jgi:hypothetical protein